MADTNATSDLQGVNCGNSFVIVPGNYSVGGAVVSPGAATRVGTSCKVPRGIPLFVCINEVV